MKICLVTGSSGLIGSEVSAYFHERGFTVHGVDNNHVQCGRKLAMDLNPGAPKFLAQDVRFLPQDCSTRRQCDDQSLDVVFTSNFFEHLPGKDALN
jgi:nucleoside-diphosphate-sugar epimerase